jgi:alpha-galactosidase
VTAPEVIFEGDDFFEKHLPYGAPRADERTSNAFTLLARRGQEAATLLGFVSGARQFSQIVFSVGDGKISRVRAVAFGDGVRVDAGATFESERLLVCFGDANALYYEYAARAAANMPRRGKRRTLHGWCSWYYYYGENTLDDIRSNLNAMRAQNLPLDLVLIDDGYQTALGDWTSIRAEKFPDGMKSIADEIHAAGKSAGIWLAPFGASATSQLVQVHPEFLLRDETGRAVRAWKHWDQEIFALDLTRTDVAAWLRELFHTVCFEWGYDAVKLDFVFAGALAGKHFDERMTRVQAYRRGLETIAETIGSEKIIMGCGAPQLASVGLVDTMRVRQEVHFAWLPADPANGGAVSTQHAVQNTLLRAPFNQLWWLNDPDCVIARKRGDVNAMTQNETRTLASVAALTGSVLLDSDNLANMSAARVNDLKRILPALDRSASVRTWFAENGAQPSQLEFKLDDGELIYAVINWSNRTRETVIELPPDEKFRVYDFWSKKDLGLKRGRVKISKHAPHQTIVLRCVPPSRKTRPNLQHIAAV